MTIEPGDMEGVLAALADATRRQLLDILAMRGEATATVLATEVPVSRQAVVKHLAILDAAGLVSWGRIGRERRYAVRPEQLEVTARWLAGLATRWEARLLALKFAAETDSDRAGSAETPAP